MDFELNDDQVSLQEGVRAFVEGRVPLDTVRELEAAGARVDRELWAELGEMGVFSVALPEADGGLGMGVAEAALVFEELGRGIVPGPLVGTALAAGLVDGAASGEAVVAVLEPAEPITVVEFPADVDALFAENDVVLYDRSTDAGEVVNLADDPAHRDLVAQCSAKLEALITAEIGGDDVSWVLERPGLMGLPPWHGDQQG